MGKVLLKMTHPIRKDSEGDPWLFSSSWDTPPPPTMFQLYHR